MAKKQLVNTETNKDVGEFIAAIANKKRQADSKELIKIIQEITGKEPKVWGVSIVGFGKYKYKRKNGEEHEWFNVGFSPARAHLTLYLMFDLGQEKLLEQLGSYRAGRGCLYIKSLQEVDLDILKQLIAKSDRWKR